MTESLEREIRDLRSLFWSERDPDGRGFASLADAYRRAGDFRQALEILGEGLERLPTFATGYAVSARVHLEAGLLEEARLAARKALALDGENVWALRALADALGLQGDEAAAAEVRASLYALDPTAEEPEAVVEIGGIAPTGAEAAEAVVEIESLAPTESEAAEAIVEIESLAPTESEAAEAIVDIESLAPTESEAAEAVVEIGSLAPTESEAAEAVVEIGSLAPEQPEEGPDWDVDDETTAQLIYTRTMAELYLRQGLEQQALEVYRHLVEADPTDEGLRARLAEVEAARDEEGGTEEEDLAESRAESPSISGYFERMLAWAPREEES